MAKLKTSNRYFLEKTSNLLTNLLIAPGDAKSRLRENELLIMFILHLDIPDELIPEQKKILTLLTRKPVLQIGEKIICSAFQNTLSGMRNSTASKVIQNINSLYHQVQCFD